MLAFPALLDTSAIPWVLRVMKAILAQLALSVMPSNRLDLQRSALLALTSQTRLRHQRMTVWFALMATSAEKEWRILSLVMQVTSALRDQRSSMLVDLVPTARLFPLSQLLALKASTAQDTGQTHTLSASTVPTVVRRPVSPLAALLVTSAPVTHLIST